MNPGRVGLARAGPGGCPPPPAPQDCGCCRARGQGPRGGSRAGPENGVRSAEVWQQREPWKGKTPGGMGCGMASWQPPGTFLRGILRQLGRLLSTEKCQEGKDEDRGGVGIGVRAGKAAERRVGEGVPSRNKGLPGEKSRTGSPSSLSGRRMQAGTPALEKASPEGRTSTILLPAKLSGRHPGPLQPPPCKACSAPHSLHPAYNSNPPLPCRSAPARVSAGGPRHLRHPSLLHT